MNSRRNFLKQFGISLTLVAISGRIVLSEIPRATIIEAQVVSFFDKLNSFVDNLRTNKYYRDYTFEPELKEALVNHKPIMPSLDRNKPSMGRLIKTSNGADINRYGRDYPEECYIQSNGISIDKYVDTINCNQFANPNLVTQTKKVS